MRDPTDTEISDGGPLVRYGKRKVLIRLACLYAINEIEDRALQSLLWDTCVQGVGLAPASKGTHKDGYCIDYSINDRRWNYQTALSALVWFERVGFAPVLRYAGELGEGEPAHFHVALLPHANSLPIATVNRRRRPYEIQVSRVFQSALWSDDKQTSQNPSSLKKVRRG